MSSPRLHRIAALLRRARLLGLADSALYLRSMLRQRQSNARFRSQQAGFAIPPAHLAFDAYGNVDNAGYAESGEYHAGVIAEAIERNLAGAYARICEWGCGPGRVIRHLQRFLKTPNAELHGTDYNGESIEWCRANLPGIGFRTNGLAPPLNYPDGHFDCIYAISVLTHLSEAKHFEWIAELARVVRPGGLVILSSHGDASAGRLLDEEKARYDSGELVVRAGVREGSKWYLAYHPPSFMRERLFAGLDVLEHGTISGTQDLWVARKRLTG